jgi:hypothetical protein
MGDVTWTDKYGKSWTLNLGEPYASFPIKMIQEVREKRREKESMEEVLMKSQRYSTHPTDYNLLFHIFTATSSKNDERSFREV